MLLFNTVQLSNFSLKMEKNHLEVQNYMFSLDVDKVMSYPNV